MSECTCNQLKLADPTRTTTVRTRFAAEFKRRYTRVKRLIVESIVTNDAFGLQRPRLKFADLVFMQAAQPGQFANRPLDQQVEDFDTWLNGEMEQELLEISPQAVESDNNTWMAIFLIGAFLRGMRRARAELIRVGWPVTQYPDTMQPRQMLAAPYIRERIAYILNRTFANVKNINETTRLTLRRVLAEALTEGVDVREMARRIVAQVDDIAIKRALLIAQTEIVAAHHLATIAEYRQAGVFGVRLMAEWVTAGDARVCSRCQALSRQDNGHGPGIYTLDQIEYMIPVHPRCRCMALPVDATEVLE